MAQPHLEVFPSEFHMLKFFGQYLPKLDVYGSAKLAPFLYKYDNSIVISKNLYQFLNQMEDLIGLGINTTASTQKGKTFLVFFDKTLKDATKFTQGAEPVKHSSDVQVIPLVEVKDVITTDLIQTEIPELNTIVNVGNLNDQPLVTEVTPEPVGNQLPKVLTDEQQEIMAQAETFRDDSQKAKAKGALETFAITKGISLSKAKTFDGMLEDLKAAL